MSFYDVLLAKNLGGSGGGTSEKSSCEKVLNGESDELILDGFTNLVNNAFYGITGYTTLDLKTVKTIGQQGFYGGQMTSINFRGVQSIGANAFNGCSKLVEIDLPNTLTQVGSYAFRSCSSLTTARFHAKPIELFNTFYSCSKLKDIYVPWAEGEVADAPWGATNATVHYNS